MQSAEEFYDALDPQPTFRIGEKVYLGFAAKNGIAGLIGELQAIDTANDEAVIVVSKGQHAFADIVKGQARFLSKLH